MRVARALGVAVAATAAAGAAYAARARRCAASRDEATRALPGDEFVPRPAASHTHAATIGRSPREVWPWLLQMGAGRAGWYSYDFIDNGRRPSLYRIAPALQHLQVGSLMPAYPGAVEGFVVLRMDPRRALVLGWPSGKGGPPVATWAFVLDPVAPGRTRLIVRSRTSPEAEPPFRLPQWAARGLLPWGHAVMQRKQLLGIRARAEDIPPAEPPTGREVLD